MLPASSGLGDEKGGDEGEKKERKVTAQARMKDWDRKREAERTAEIASLEKDDTTSDGCICVYVYMYIYLCVWGFAHAHSCCSYFMAKLFREKNNSISRHTGYGSRHSYSNISVAFTIRNIDRKIDRLSLLALDIGSRVSIITWKK